MTLDVRSGSTGRFGSTGGSALLTSPLDEQRRVALRRMKTIATSLLLVMAAIFVIAWLLEPSYPWLGYVRAAAEAGMVGALADWFAVTALFRHPLGLPIPHTAIIPSRKDHIGSSLSQFIAENFLNEDVVRGKLSRLMLANRLGNWLSRDAGSQRVAERAGFRRERVEPAARVVKGESWDIVWYGLDRPAER